LDLVARRLPPHRYSEAHNTRLFDHRRGVARSEKRRNSDSKGDSQSRVVQGEEVIGTGEIAKMSFERLKEFGLELYDRGFNIVATNREKRPITSSWSADERVYRKELENALNRAEGIGIVGGSENPFKSEGLDVALVDVDFTKDLNKKMPKLYSLLEKTIVWLTGVRCPVCYKKHVHQTDKGYKCLDCGAEFRKEEAKRGFAGIFLVERGLISSTIRSESVELLYNNLERIPPSIHPSGILYEFGRPFDFNAKYFGIYKLSKDELETIKNEIEKERLSPEKLRTLTDSKILEIENLLKPFYKQGRRQYIWFYLSGWLAKARVSPVSAAKILGMLYKESKDEDPIIMRVTAIIRSYSRAGIDIESYRNEFEEALGLSGFDITKVENEEREIKGVSGLQELLIEDVGTEEALRIIKDIEEILGTASPYQDSIFGRPLAFFNGNSDKPIYILANLRDLQIVKAIQEGQRMKYRNVIFEGAPTELTVIENPITGGREFQIKWEAKTLNKPIFIPAAKLDAIVAKLKSESLVISSRDAADALSALITAYIEKGKATIREEAEQAGFYYKDGKIIAVSVDTSLPTKEEMREALSFLNELADWYRYAKARFSRIVKLGSILPFDYAYKQQFKNFIKWLYFIGPSGTGKTTQAYIILSMWGLDPQDPTHSMGGASVNTEATLGQKLGNSTFPIVINEPAGVFQNPAEVEMIKNAVENPTARSRHTNGINKDYPALSPVIFTSNHIVPQDDSLLRRMEIHWFSLSETNEIERIKREKREKLGLKEKEDIDLQALIISKRDTLKNIGRFVANYIVSNGLQRDWESYVTKILREMYKYAEMDVPSWVDLEIEENEDSPLREVYENKREEVRNILANKINLTFSQSISRITETNEYGTTTDIIDKANASFEQRLDAVLEKGLIPYLIQKGEYIYITPAIVSDLIKVGIETLKALADLMGWEYVQKSYREGGKVNNNYVIRVSLATFKQFLIPTFEEGQSQI